MKHEQKEALQSELSIFKEKYKNKREFYVKIQNENKQLLEKVDQSKTKVK